MYAIRSYYANTHIRDTGHGDDVTGLYLALLYALQVAEGIQLGDVASIVRHHHELV